MGTTRSTRGWEMNKDQKKQAVVEALRGDIDAMELLSFLKYVALNHGWQQIGIDARELLDKRGLSCLYMKNEARDAAQSEGDK